VSTAIASERFVVHALTTSSISLQIPLGRLDCLRDNRILLNSWQTLSKACACVAERAHVNIASAVATLLVPLPAVRMGSEGHENIGSTVFSSLLIVEIQQVCFELVRMRSQ